MHYVVDEVVDNGENIQKKIEVVTKDKYELKKDIQILENDCIYECVKLIENNVIK